MIVSDNKIALSGECADEIFGGYPWYYRKDLKNDIFPWLRSTEEKTKLVNDSITNKFNPIDFIYDKYNNTVKEIKWSGNETKEEIEMKKMMYINFKWFMNTLLDRKDRMSMACGLEVRVPFCDHRIVEYLWNVPWEMKYYKEREKGLLRKAFEKQLPYEVGWRKKAPYPKTHNPIYLKLAKERLKNIIDDNNSQINDIFSNKQIKELIESDGKTFKLPWFGQLMTGPQIMAYLIQINDWINEYNIKIIL